jgi:phospholipase A1
VLQAKGHRVATAGFAMKIRSPVLFRVLNILIYLSAGVYTFAQPEDNNFFDEYLYGPLRVESYQTTYFMPFFMDFQEHGDRNAIETSFQISFKKDVVKNISPIGFDIGIACTLTAWWQLYAFSNPFRETNYGPEFYINFPFHRDSGETGVFFHGIKIAAAHKSNGLGDGNNRSWNRVYLEAPIAIKRFLFIPRVWWSFVGTTNDFSEADIPRYTGMCDLTIVSHWNSHVLRVYGRSNFNFRNIKAALQVDYSYPISTTGFYFYLQYFLGYGESLIDYDKPVNKIGTGLALSR